MCRRGIGRLPGPTGAGVTSDGRRSLTMTSGLLALLATPEEDLGPPTVA